MLMAHASYGEWVLHKIQVVLTHLRQFQIYCLQQETIDVKVPVLTHYVDIITYKEHVIWVHLQHGYQGIIMLQKIIHVKNSSKHKVLHVMKYIELPTY